MVKFMIRYFSEKTCTTVRDTIEGQTIGEVLKKAIALTIGQQARDLVIIQEDSDERNY